MMITVSELEAIIAQALPGEQVQYDGKPIGSIDQMTRKLNELKLNGSFRRVPFSGLLDHRRPAGISCTARQTARSRS
jgi:hypothetical protein